MAGKKAKPKGAKGSNGLALVGMVTGGLVALVLLGVGVSMLSSSPPAPAAKPAAAEPAASTATPSLYDLVAAHLLAQGEGPADAQRRLAVRLDFERVFAAGNLARKVRRQA